MDGYERPRPPGAVLQAGSQMRAGLASRHDYADSNASMAPPMPRRGLALLVDQARESASLAFKLSQELANTNDRVHGMHVPMPEGAEKTNPVTGDSTPLYLQLEGQLAVLRIALAELSVQIDRAALL